MFFCWFVPGLPQTSATENQHITVWLVNTLNLSPKSILITPNPRYFGQLKITPHTSLSSRNFSSASGTLFSDPLFGLRPWNPLGNVRRLDLLECLLCKILNSHHWRLMDSSVWRSWKKSCRLACSCWCWWWWW